MSSKTTKNSDSPRASFALPLICLFALLILMIFKTSIFKTSGEGASTSTTEVLQAELGNETEDIASASKGKRSETKDLEGNTAALSSGPNLGSEDQARMFSEIEKFSRWFDSPEILVSAEEFDYAVEAWVQKLRADQIPFLNALVLNENLKNSTRWISALALAQVSKLHRLDISSTVSDLQAKLTHHQEFLNGKDPHHHLQRQLQFERSLLQAIIRSSKGSDI